MLLILTGILLMSFPPTLVIWLYKEAKNKKRATLVEEGTIEARESGNNFDGFMINIDGHHPTRNDNLTEIVPDSETSPPPPQTWLKSKWGFFWVGLLWPATRVKELRISKHRMISDEARKKQPIEEWVTTEENVPVKFLLWEIPRPILTDSIELPGDNVPIRIVWIATFRVRFPYKPMFIYRGKFLDLLDKAVSGTNHAILQSAKNSKGEPLTSEDFRQNDGNCLSKLTEAMLDLNFKARSETTINIVDTYGIELVKLAYVGFDVDQIAKDVINAQRQSAVKAALGDADIVASEKRQTSRGIDAATDANYTTVTGNAEAAVMQKKASAFVDNPNGAHVAGLEQVSKMKNLKVLGSASTMIDLRDDQVDSVDPEKKEVSLTPSEQDPNKVTERATQETPQKADVSDQKIETSPEKTREKKGKKKDKKNK